MIIKSINWKQFGEPTISIKKDKFKGKKHLMLEVSQKGADGKRFYPGKYKITPEMAKTTFTYDWGNAYIFALDDLSNQSLDDVVSSVKGLSTVEKSEFFKLLNDLI